MLRLFLFLVTNGQDLVDEPNMAKLIEEFGKVRKM